MEGLEILMSEIRSALNKIMSKKVTEPDGIGKKDTIGQNQ